MRLTKLSVIAFVGPETLPLQVGGELGFYEAAGLDVAWAAAGGSVDQMTRLCDGRCDVVMTAIDNIVAYVEGQGAAGIAPAPDLAAFLGCASEPRPLIAAPGITAFAELRGARIAVDALNTGFSFLLRRMLADNGLGSADYELVPVGAPPARWRAIETGDCAAALLSEALAAIAIDAGCVELCPDPDPWACYQGGVYAARRGWIAAHADTVKAFIRATLAATGWVLDPANAPALPDLLRRHLPHMGDAAAKAAADNLHGSDPLLKPDLPIDIEGFRAVLALRAQYGTPRKPLGGPEKYLDLSRYDAVMGG